MDYLALNWMDFAQIKPYNSDGMHNKAVNTDESKGGTPYPDVLTYWNFYHTDESIETKWIFYTYIDHISFIGGILDIWLSLPIGLMLIYTFKLNEINVFYYQQKIYNMAMEQAKGLSTYKPDFTDSSRFTDYILKYSGTLSLRIAFFYSCIKPCRNG